MVELAILLPKAWDYCKSFSGHAHVPPATVGQCHSGFRLCMDGGDKMLILVVDRWRDWEDVDDGVVSLPFPSASALVQRRNSTAGNLPVCNQWVRLHYLEDVILLPPSPSTR